MDTEFLVKWSSLLPYSKMHSFYGLRNSTEVWMSSKSSRAEEKFAVVFFKVNLVSNMLVIDLRPNRAHRLNLFRFESLDDKTFYEKMMEMSVFAVIKRILMRSVLIVPTNSKNIAADMRVFDFSKLNAENDRLTDFDVIKMTSGICQNPEMLNFNDVGKIKECLDHVRLTQIIDGVVPTQNEARNPSYCKLPIIRIHQNNMPQTLAINSSTYLLWVYTATDNLVSLKFTSIENPAHMSLITLINSFFYNTFETCVSAIGNKTLCTRLCEKFKFCLSTEQYRVMVLALNLVESLNRENVLKLCQLLEVEVPETFQINSEHAAKNTSDSSDQQPVELIDDSDDSDDSDILDLDPTDFEGANSSFNPIVIDDDIPSKEVEQSATTRPQISEPETSAPPTRAEVPIVTEKAEVQVIVAKPDVPIIEKVADAPILTNKVEAPKSADKTVSAAVFEKPFVPLAAEKAVLPKATEKPVVPVATEKPVLSAAAEKPVVCLAAEKAVLPAAIEKSVSPKATEKPVLSAATNKPVVPAAANKTILSAAAEKPVVPVAAKKAISSAATEKLVTLAATEKVETPLVAQRAYVPHVAQNENVSTAAEKVDAPKVPETPSVPVVIESTEAPQAIESLLTLIDTKKADAHSGNKAKEDVRNKSHPEPIDVEMIDDNNTDEADLTNNVRKTIVPLEELKYEPEMDDSQVERTLVTLLQKNGVKLADLDKKDTGDDAQTNEKFKIILPPISGKIQKFSQLTLNKHNSSNLSVIKRLLLEVAKDKSEYTREDYFAIIEFMRECLAEAKTYSKTLQTHATLEIDRLRVLKNTKIKELELEAKRRELQQQAELESLRTQIEHKEFEMVKRDFNKRFR